MITVVGCDGSPLPQRAMDRLGAAVLVAGGRRHLEAVRPPAHVRQVVMGDVAAALDAVEASADDGVVVLASGDPGFFGIVRALRERGHAPEVLPAVSSVAGAFARIGLPWDDVVVTSAHGRDPRTAVNACRAMAKTAVFTAPGFGPAALGAELAGWDRTLHVAERLGGPDERVTRCTPAEAAARDWAEPNVVLAVREGALGAPARRHNQPASPPRTHSGDSYRHRAGMITKWEVRAVALARLRPTLGMLVWDVGAGSGSVGIECAEHHAAVIAIERDPAARDLIRHNAGTADVRVVAESAPEAFDGLPDPDAVFVGGGGLEALSGVLARGPKTVVATYAAVDRAALARRLMADAGYAVEGGQLSAARFADLPGGSFRLDAQNPVFLLAGSAS
ncbi:precorrin-6y C5,15-methyltransferase (decarboxylating) subunit CbiE [Actinomadura sp. DC4]|uniref:precorrin-6y C5,15-methyltransferase (decarboxylating) subunit CbiE n=1 Tax=Actinomadura sp. DC4 TaxID=3055069 RepID=UPI0025AFD6D1|nr:precorrin-6y C5,15-methyltransferase (decarboxylating) subunit CbiE [Actinomadura sp. DC4]MDN3357452.1 precorrin-6y C5,15-methyltransferase (decarboxylating) subunit CbiE [Actinomadura sp. DC4]